MPLFPLYIDLSGKKCVFIGGGKVAARKIETLLLFHPMIVVVSPDVTPEIVQLEAEGKLAVYRRTYSEEDLEGAFLVFAATDDRLLNQEVYRSARERNILVNTVDCPEECTFIFPSIVKRNDLVIGISTSGNYPALSKRVREKIESSVPEEYGKALEVLKCYRQRALEEINDKKERKRIIHKVLDEIFAFERIFNIDEMTTKLDRIFEVYKNGKKD